MHEPDPLTLRPPLYKAFVLLAVCCGFVAVGVWMVKSGEEMGYLCAGFFGLGIPVSLVQMLPGSTGLRIDASGFTVTNLYRKWAVPFSDIQEFFVVVLPASRRRGVLNEMVGFNYVPGYDRARAGRALAQALANCEGALPDTYGMKAREMVDLLNERLRAARGASGVPTAQR